MELTRAFKLVQDRVDLPDVTIQLGQYEWKVHRVVLTTKSSYFRSALGNPCKEAGTQNVAIDDDPWLFARLVQYLYEGSYQGHQEHHHLVGSGIIDLPVMMSRFSHADAHADAQIDRQRRPCMIHCMMASRGDKYGIPLLVGSAAAMMFSAFRQDPPNDDVEGEFWSLYQTLGSESLSRYVLVETAFVHMAAAQFPRLDSRRLRTWCNHHALGYCIAQSLSQSQPQVLPETPIDVGKDDDSEGATSGP
ncbi:hypothetical protein H2198_005057 [Neophaeococcomyces mojaviensis]|uniref:Uncharacterized protein n=1 Tax=Neophaeococcomyces mojaviensis TaxID=3383035 RepID=A0ACC3A774_9EURO|nr:hypothetical protein H2198_005057 [Knufia sp. JES_112]